MPSPNPSRPGLVLFICGCSALICGLGLASIDVDPSTGNLLAQIGGACLSIGLAIEIFCIGSWVLDLRRRLEDVSLLIGSYPASPRPALGQSPAAAPSRISGDPTLRSNSAWL